MLETAIVKSRKMDVMERVRVDTILEEQLLGQVDLTTSRGEIGNLIGIDYMILSPNELHYWAPHPVKRIKVDFLLRRGNDLAAIEVMSQPRYRTGMLPGLRAFGELPGLVAAGARLRRQAVVSSDRGRYRRVVCRVTATRTGRKFPLARRHAAGHIAMVNWAPAGLTPSGLFMVAEGETA